MLDSQTASYRIFPFGHGILFQGKNTEIWSCSVWLSEDSLDTFAST